VPAIVTFIIGYLTGEFLEQAVVESISGQPHRSSSTHPNVPDSSRSSLRLRPFAPGSRRLKPAGSIRRMVKSSERR
jgi:hypothetical protein